LRIKNNEKDKSPMAIYMFSVLGYRRRSSSRCRCIVGVCINFNNDHRFRSGIARNIGRFCLHVYFPLRGSVTGPTHVIGEVSRPVLLGGLASMATFDVMFLSSLPGQREPAVFSIIGTSGDQTIKITRTK